MWEPEHRVVADRSGLRYPSDLADAEWAIVEAMIPPAKHGGRQRTIDVREVLDGIPTTAIIDSQSAKGAQKGGFNNDESLLTRTSY
jgi:hypothetical protein